MPPEFVVELAITHFLDPDSMAFNDCQTELQRDRLELLRLEKLQRATTVAQRSATSKAIGDCPKGAALARSHFLDLAVSVFRHPCGKGGFPVTQTIKLEQRGNPNDYPPAKTTPDFL